MRSPTLTFVDTSLLRNDATTSHIVVSRGRALHQQLQQTHPASHPNQRLSPPRIDGSASTCAPIGDSRGLNTARDTLTCASTGATRRIPSCIALSAVFVGLCATTAHAAAVSLSTSETRNVASTNPPGASIDGFELHTAATVLTISNADPSTIATEYTTRIANGVLQDDSQAILISADPIASPPTGRAPWTISVKDISFSTPNGRVEFTGRFPSGSQIAVTGLTYTALPAGPLARPANEESAFVIIDDVALIGGAHLRLAGLSLRRDRWCELAAPFVRVGRLNMEGASRLTIGGGGGTATTLSIVDAPGQDVTSLECSLEITIMHQLSAIRVEALSLAGGSHFFVDSVALTQTATTLDFTALLAVKGLQSTSNSSVSVVRNSFTVVSPLTPNDEPAFDTTNHGYKPQSTLLAITGDLSLSDASSIAVKENTFLDESCPILSPTWPAGSSDGRLNFFISANRLISPTLESGVLIAVEENSGDARCAAFGALFSAESGAVSDATIRIASNNATNFWASYEHSNYGSLMAFSGLEVTIANNIAPWGRTFATFGRAPICIYGNVAVARSFFNVSANTLAFIRDEHFDAVRAAPAQTLNVVIETFGDDNSIVEDSVIFITRNFVTFPSASADRAFLTPFSHVFADALFSLSAPPLLRTIVKLD